MGDSSVRFGAQGAAGTGGQHLPFARAASADGWLFVSGQTPMVNGEVILGGIVEQSHLSHVKDGGFWMVKEFFNMSVMQTLKTWAVLETLISVTALLLTLALPLIV